MIYFIQAGDSGPIKIGFANEPEQRKKDLQVAHYEGLRTIGIINGNMALEKELHRKFERHRIRGEWLRPGTEILEYIKANCQKIMSNTVYKLDNGEYRIIYYRPHKSKVDDVLFYGSHNIRILVDRETNTVLGFEGRRDILENFLRDKGVNAKALQEFIDATRD